MRVIRTSVRPGGVFSNFLVGGTADDLPSGGEGPKMMVYLNTPDFPGGSGTRLLISLQSWKMKMVSIRWVMVSDMIFLFVSMEK